MNEILERNLQALLRRYRPAHPSEAFQRALREALRRAVARNGAAAGTALHTAPIHPRYFRRRYVWIAAAALIAALLPLLGGWGDSGQRGASGVGEVASNQAPPHPERFGPGPADRDGEELESEAPQPLSRRLAAGDPRASTTEAPSDALPKGGSAAEDSAGASDAEGGALAHLELSVRSAAGEPLESFVLWTRIEQPLPRVTVPTRRTIERSGPGAPLALLPATYPLLGEAPGHAPAKLTGVALGGGELRALSVDLQEGGSAEGYVVDAETGAPLAQALVLSEPDSPFQVLDLSGARLHPLPAAATRTDGAGHYRLDHLSLGTQRLRISAPGYAPTWTPAFTLAAGAPVSSPDGSAARPHHTLELTELGAGATVEGVVAAPGGGGEEGVRVILSMMLLDPAQEVMAYGQALTDADGFYRVEHLPPGPLVALTLGADGETRAVRQVYARAGGVTRVDFPAQGAGGTRLFGHIQRAGRPLAGYQVTLTPKSSPHGFDDFVSAIAGPDGSFSFEGLLPGRFDLYAGSSLDSLVYRDSIEVGAPGELSLELTLPAGRIDGTIDLPADARSGSINVILMQLGGGEPRFRGIAHPTPAGEFQFDGLAEGRYQLSLVTRDGAVGSQVADPITLTAENSPRVSFHADPGGELDLRLRCEDGQPGAGLLVELLDASGRSLAYGASRESDSEGHCPIPPLAPGLWTVVVHQHESAGIPSPGARTTDSTVRQTVRIEQGKREELTLILPR